MEWDFEMWVILFLRTKDAESNACALQGHQNMASSREIHKLNV